MTCSVTEVAVRQVSTSSPEAERTAKTHLLPPPASGGDPLVALFALQIGVQHAGRRERLDQAEDNQRRIREARARMRRALHEAHRAQRRKRPWLRIGKLAKVVALGASVVGSAALAVASAGAATPIAALAITGAALSGAGLLVSETHALQQFGLSDKTAGSIGICLSVAGGVSSLGAGALGVTAGLEGAVGKAAAAAQITGGTAGVASGAVQIPVAYWERESKDRGTDAFQAQRETAQIRRLLQHLIEQLGEQEQSDRRTFERLADSARVRDDIAHDSAGTPCRG